MDMSYEERKKMDMVRERWVVQIELTNKLEKNIKGLRTAETETWYEEIKPNPDTEKIKKNLHSCITNLNLIIEEVNTYKRIIKHIYNIE